MADIAIRIASEEYNSQDVLDYICSHKGSTFYHRPEWSRFLQSAYNYLPCHLIARQGKEIVGLLPLFQIRTLFSGHRFVSLPFSHLAGPLSNTEQISSTLIEYAAELAFSKGADHLLVKSRGITGTDAHNRQYPFTTSLLDINIDFETIWENIKSTTRRNVRKAEKSGITVVETSVPLDFHAYNDLMYETRKRQGVPGYPQRYFDKLYDCLHLTDAVRLYIAQLDKRTVAGVILSFHRDTATYLYGASRNSPQILRTRPNDLLFWHAISDARKRGYRQFDFGLTHTGNEGLLRFKEGWGAQSEAIIYQYITRGKRDSIGANRDSAPIKLASWCLRNMPMQLYKSVSSVLIKQLG